MNGRMNSSTAAQIGMAIASAAAVLSLAACGSGSQVVDDADVQQMETVKVETPPDAGQREPDYTKMIAETPPVSPEVRPSGVDKWWEQTPDVEDGRIRIISGGVGGSMRASKDAAVEAAYRSLAGLVGGEPARVKLERTTTLEKDDGTWQGYVLASCDEG